MYFRFGGTWNEIVKSESLDTFKFVKVLVVGVASIKSSVLTTAVTF